MAALFALVWLIGGTALGVLSIPAGSENPRVARLARIAGGFLLVLIALGVAVTFSSANANPLANYRPSRSGWWVVAIVGGIPFAFTYAAAMRRAFTRRRLVLTLVTLDSAATYLVFPYAFVPRSAALQGLGLWVHRHHAVDVLILTLPAVITLLGELVGVRGAARPEESEPLAQP